jgi:Ca2+-binding EF-hand superfamily protein
MKTLRLMTLVFGAALVLLSMHYALAEAEKKARTSVHSKGQPAKADALENRADAFFKTNDINKDGKISHDEYMMRYEERFKSTDTNHDGFLLRAELKQYWQERRREHAKTIQKALKKKPSE